jgi:hypothetical protein
MATPWLTLHRPADRLGRDAVAVALEADEAGLRHRHRCLGVAVKGALPWHERGALLLEHLENGLVLKLRMPGPRGVGERALAQDRVELVIIGDAQPGREDRLTRGLHLVLDLPARHCRSDQWRDRARCRRSRARRPRQGRRRPGRGRRTPSTGSRGDRRPGSASACSRAGYAPPSPWS